MRLIRGCLCLVVLLCCTGWAQQPSTTPTPGSAQQPGPASPEDKLKELLAANVKAEWEAFKNKDKKAFSDLLTDDFAAVEDDNQGMRKKAQAVAEVDQSVVKDYNLFALRVIPLESNTALVTYELSMLFPPQAAVRFKRVLVSEIWVKRDGQWKQRYYQETHVR
jgi:hypothetical protein